MYVDDIKGPFLPPLPSRRVPTTNQIKSLKSQLKVMVSRVDAGDWGIAFTRMRLVASVCSKNIIGHNWSGAECHS